MKFVSKDDPRHYGLKSTTFSTLSPVFVTRERGSVNPDYREPTAPNTGVLRSDRRSNRDRLPSSPMQTP